MTFDATPSPDDPLLMTMLKANRQGRRGPNSHLDNDSPVFICRRCGETKPRTEFYYKASGRPMALCRPCTRITQREDYAKNPDAAKARDRRSRENNRGQKAAYKAAYYRANREKIQAYAKEYAKTWQPANRDKANARNHRRKAREAIAVMIPFTDEQLAARIEYYEGRCWMCGGEAQGLDHVKPLFHSGPDMLSNLRPACTSCNRSKGRTWPFDTHVHGTPRSSLRPDVEAYGTIRQDAIT